MKHFYSSSKKLLAAILLLQFIITTANAQWSTDPNVNNAICIASDIQRGQAVNQYSTMVSDGSGGVIITWADYRNGGIVASDIYAQRIDANGVVQWTTDGVPVCTAAGSQRDPTITSDGSGGAIIVWWDNRIANIDIYAQRINASGIVQWTADGVRISTATTVQQLPNITSDGNHGAIISWDEWNFNSGNMDIYAQRLDANGNAQWTTNGVIISAALYTQQSSSIISDGSGGAIIAWRDMRSNISSGFYAQRINASGAVLWTADGVAISTADGMNYVSLTSDGNGGAIFSWTDSRNGASNFNIYAQHLNDVGVAQWTLNGVAICTAAYSQQYQDIVSDGNGGAIITWDDGRSASGTVDVYAQRINGSGLVQWTADGVPISTVAASHQRFPSITSDGNGGAIIIWEDRRSLVTLADTYAQRINSSGVVQWTTNGVAISTATGLQEIPFIISDGNGGAIMTWRDSRNGGVSNYDIYIQQVGTNGVLGNITTGVEEKPAGIHNLLLSQNYPNPFKQSTKIKYEIGSGQLVLLRVSDLSGKEIKTLVNKEQPAGSYEIDFDGSKMGSGTYIIELQAGLLRETKKMILLK